jgi:hypothetical protein
MPEPTNYVKEAFKRQENVISLAGLAVAGAVFNPGFFFVAGALELGYLWMMATNKRFQRVIDSEKNQRRVLSDEQVKLGMLSRLSKPEQARYQELTSIRQRVFDSWQGRDSVSQSLLSPSVEKLDYLLDTFLRSQIALSRMRTHLATSDRAFLSKQAEMIQTELKGNLSPKLREMKQKNLELLVSRLSRLSKINEDIEISRTQLDTLEQAVKFISDQSAALTDPQQISAQIDRAVADVADTERSLREVETFLDAQDDKKEDAAKQAQAQEQKPQ